MPIYEYRCVACGRDIEVIHGIHAEGPTSCDVCGSPMRKLLTSPAIVFRGGGWAKKDARESRSARSAGGTASETEKAASEAGKSAGVEKSPAGEAASGRDTPASSETKRSGSEGRSEAGRASKPSSSDD
jgi:putative FmdB family regulatory protein